MRDDEPGFIAEILESGWFWLLTRIIAAFMFWITGLGWIVNLQGAAGAAGSVGLSPAGVWGVALILFYLAGSAAIIADRYLWLAAGAYAVFTLLTIIMVHHWWTMPADQAHEAWLTAKEHVTVIGGLMALAVASHWRGIQIGRRRP